jgi:hypothetical protein
MASRKSNFDYREAEQQATLRATCLLSNDPHFLLDEEAQE